PIQTAIHVVNRFGNRGQTPYDPEGWHNQVADGGSLTAMYQRAWIGRIGIPSKYLDAAHALDASVGYYTGVSYAVVGKFGRFAKDGVQPFWTMTTEIDPQSDADQLMSDGRRIKEWYVLVG